MEKAEFTPGTQRPGEVDLRPVRDEAATPEPLPPPRMAVVLAAGRSERLSEVTGGGSKALVRVGGLALVERAIRTALAAGVEGVVVVCGYHAGPVAAVATRAAPGRVKVVVAEDWEKGNGASLVAAEPALVDEPSFLLLTADHLFAEGALAQLAAGGAPAVLVDPAPDPAVVDEATKVTIGSRGEVVALGKQVVSPVVDCGAFLLGPDAFGAARASLAAGRGTLSEAVEELARRRRVVAVPLRTGIWWQDVDTPADLSRARGLLRGSLRRSSDGPVSALLNRRVSIPISWALAPLRPNPDLVSVLAFAVGIVAAALLGMGHGLAGGLLVQACSVLDGVDGEVARLALRAGPRGTLLDGVLDRVSDAAIIGGLGLWAAGTAAPGVVIPLTVAATAGALLSMSSKDRIAALGLAPPSERRLGWLLGGRDGRLFLVFVLAVAGSPVAALAVTAATSLLATGLRVAFARAYPP
ncbi:MAG TPA: NTP transferase domain-containing protein [Actinomycetota bacterium]|nr:NTP transferase domain-containing protein [Actinomycetota bacterium]